MLTEAIILFELPGAAAAGLKTESANPTNPTYSNLAQLPIEICITGFEFQAINLSTVDIIL